MQLVTLLGVSDPTIRMSLKCYESRVRMVICRVKVRCLITTDSCKINTETLTQLVLVPISLEVSCNFYVFTYLRNIRFYVKLCSMEKLQTFTIQLLLYSFRKFRELKNKVVEGEGSTYDLLLQKQPGIIVKLNSSLGIISLTHYSRLFRFFLLQSDLLKNSVQDQFYPSF